MISEEEQAHRAPVITQTCENGISAPHEIPDHLRTAFILYLADQVAVIRETNTVIQRADLKQAAARGVTAAVLARRELVLITITQGCAVNGKILHFLLVTIDIA